MFEKQDKANRTFMLHKQESMILVTKDALGVQIVTPLNVFGYDDAPHGHAKFVFQNVCMPTTNNKYSYWRRSWF